MKRLLILLAMVAVIGTSYGQKKPKVNAAEKAREDGNLGEAKEIIDEAIEHEKTKDDGKTWYYRGLIYSSLDTTSNSEFQNLSNDPLAEAMRSFAKADEISGGDDNNYYITDASGLPVFKNQQISNLWAYYLNKGVESYQSDDVPGALSNFNKTTEILPDDTTGYIYAASAAQTLEKYDVAADYYYTLIDDMDYASEDTYNALLYIETQINKDNEKAMELVKRAKAEFPENTQFAKTEINLLIQSGKAEEATQQLEKAIEAEPNNPDLYFSLGVMHDELGNTEEAISAYEKSIGIDPNYYNSNYNLAVLRVNQAIELLKERNNLGISAADQKKAKEMDEKINDTLATSLPLWEKSNELMPDDRKTLETLQYIYVQLKMNDKAVKIADQLKSIPE